MPNTATTAPTADTKNHTPATMHQVLALNTEDAAPVIGVSVATLRRWRLEGIGPAYLRPSKNLVLYRVTDLEEWLDTRTRVVGGAA